MRDLKLQIAETENRVIAAQQRCKNYLRIGKETFVQDYQKPLLILGATLGLRKLLFKSRRKKYSRNKSRWLALVNLQRLVMQWLRL